MPLNLYKRPNGVFYIRGVVQDRRFDQSARTRVRTEAEQIRAKLEADAFKRSVYGEDAVATFAEAAEAYMLAGGGRDHMKPLLLRLGQKKLRDITQGDLDKFAAEKPDAKPATLLRQIYTPVTAVMTFASSPAGGKLCPKPAFRKPKVKDGRTDYLDPAQAELLISEAPDYLRRLIVFLLTCGCRITEAVELCWRDVSVDGHRVVFWDTKGGYARSASLGRRAREALGERGADDALVFVSSEGTPWSSYGAVNQALKRMRTPIHRPNVKYTLPNRKPDRLDLPIATCHLFRHTWATWAYACTRDLTFLMSQGGWRSLTMVQRYTHAGSPGLAAAVIALGWEFDGRELPGLTPKGRKSK